MQTVSGTSVKWSFEQNPSPSANIISPNPYTGATQPLNLDIYNFLSLTITDISAADTVSLSLDQNSQVDVTTIQENGGIATIWATRTGSTAAIEDVQVDFYYGAATLASDFVLPDSPPSYWISTTPQHYAYIIRIPAGATKAGMRVQGLSDGTVENDEKITFKIHGTSSTSFNAAKNYEIVLDDNSAQVSLAINNVSLAESGGTATITGTLSPVNPFQAVTATLVPSGSATGADYSGCSTLTFAANASTATCVLTAVNDASDEVDETLTLGIGSVTNGSAGATPSVSATIVDDDGPGVSLAVANASIPETGGSTTVTATLTAASPQDVTVSLSLTGTATVGADYTASATSLTIPAGSTQRSVTLTSVSDLVDEANETIAVDVSSVSNGTGTGTQQVTVTIADDDTAGVTVNPASPHVTTEAGGTSTFTVVLTSEPTASVTVNLASSDSTEGTLSAGGVTFTTSNWSTPQAVTLNGVDDSIDDGNQSYNALITVTSADAVYAAIDPADVAATNTDDDTAGVTVAPTSGLVTTEAVASATFTVRLLTEPLGDVVIDVASLDVTEASVAPAQLTFTNANWATAQTVTVTGAADAIDDGNQAYTIALSTNAAATADATYDAINPEDVSGSNTDDDTAGIVVSGGPLTTTEAGGTATFAVVLTSEPLGNVVIDLASSDSAEAALSVSQLLFNASNWSSARTVTVTGQDDLLDDGDKPFTVTLTTNAAATDDALYDAINPADVTGTNVDNDDPGIIVTPTSGLTTSESGGTATFSVSLSSQPASNVVIDVASTAVTEASVSHATLTFTPSNFATAQVVTLTGIDDFIVDGDAPFSVTLTMNAVTTDPVYGVLNPPDVSGTNIDNDIAGVTVTPVTGLITTEAGGTATFTVVLTSQPAGDVVVNVASSDAGEGTVSTAALTFTPSDWSTAKTVTLTGVDDPQDDGDQSYNIILSVDAAATADPLYDVVNPADVSVTNTDNDTAAVIVTPVAGLVTTEAGGQASFNVVLGSAPTGDVFISVATPGIEGTVAPFGFLFTAANWNVAQTVEVTGVDDQVDDGDQAYTVSVNMAGGTADLLYAAIDPPNVGVTNLDDDVAGVTIVQVSGSSITTEAGGTATVEVSIHTQPAGSVALNFASTNPAEGTVSVAQLVFGPSNWQTTRTVTLTGVDDDVDDGDQPYIVTVSMDPVATTDPVYNAIDPADISATNTDDETAAVQVTAISGPITEAGGSATFDVVLSSQPTGNVVINVVTGNANEGTVAPAQLTFTPGDWSQAQTVTVTGVDDEIDDGDQAFAVSLAMAGATADPLYAAIDPADVNVTNVDDDTAALIVNPSSGLVTSEGGATANFSVALGSEPTSNVVIDVASADATEGVASPVQLTFTASNWATAQSVTVTGVPDAIDDGDQAYTVALTVNAAATSDGNYSGLVAAGVSLTNTDDDSVGISVVPTGGLTTTEAAGTATFAIVLQSEPVGDVVVTLSSSDSSEGTVSSTALTFRASDWSLPQTVTITGVDDDVDDGDQSYAIVVGVDAAATADPLYDAIDPPDVAVVNSDDDTAAILVNPVTGLTTTESAGTAAFTIRLASEPIASVVIDVASSDPGEASVSPAQLTFTSATWNAPQTITVTGVDDSLDDGDQTYNVVVATSASTTDASYAALDPADVSATNTDDDGVAVEVTPASGLITTEAGGAATFSVVLRSEPLGNVVIDLASNDLTEATVSPAQLTFTAGTWSVPQVVTLTGVDDSTGDGDQPYVVALTMNASTADAAYAALDPQDVTATNLDDDPARLVFVVQPSTTIGGSAIAPAVVVQLVDVNGDPVNSSAFVTIALGANPGGGTLTGMLTVAAAGGVATFSNLSVDLAGNGYTLVATSVGLTPATSNPFEILPNAVTTFSGPSATGTGTVTVSFSGGGSACTFIYAELLGQPPGTFPVPPTTPGLVFPHGLLRFELGDCQPASEVTFTVKYPAPLPAGTRYWKYGPIAPGGAPQWYELPATIEGDTVTFSVFDGGAGDWDRIANGRIVDPGGAAIAVASDIPTLPEWALLLLATMLAGVAVVRMRG